MPATPSKTESHAAERMLAELLKSWPSTGSVDPTPAPQHHVFRVAFLPAASHQAPRLPTFRLASPRTPTVGRNPTPGRWRASDDTAPNQEGLRNRKAPTFEAVTRAIEADWAADAPMHPEGAESAPEAAQAPWPESSMDEGRFAARIVALKAAGALDPPATHAGGSPAPAGYADRYRLDGSDDTSDDHLSALSAIVDLDPRLGDLIRPHVGIVPVSGAFASDDDEPAPVPPRTIFL